MLDRSTATLWARPFFPQNVHAPRWKCTWPRFGDVFEMVLKITVLKFCCFIYCLSDFKKKMQNWEQTKQWSCCVRLVQDVASNPAYNRLNRGASRRFKIKAMVAFVIRMLLKNNSVLIYFESHETHGDSSSKRRPNYACVVRGASLNPKLGKPKYSKQQSGNDTSNMRRE